MPFTTTLIRGKKYPKVYHDESVRRQNRRVNALLDLHGPKTTVTFNGKHTIVNASAYYDKETGY